jgi:dTMP kinase
VPLKVAPFISVEGGEGVGKSTLVATLAERLSARGLAVDVTREPGGTPVADAIRSLFRQIPAGDKMDSWTEFLLVTAARRRHVLQRIKPHREAGTWVLCDRFFDSSLVYQGVLGGIPDDELKTLHRWACFDYQPDLTFVLDCPTAVSSKRLSGRQSAEKDRYDGAGLATHEKLREGFRQLVAKNPRRMVAVNAECSATQVADECWQVIIERLLQ